MKQPSTIAIVADEPQQRNELAGALACVEGLQPAIHSFASDSASIADIEKLRPDLVVFGSSLAPAAVGAICARLRRRHPALAALHLDGTGQSSHYGDQEARALARCDLSPKLLRAALDSSVQSAMLRHADTRRRILVVDDSQDDQDLIRRALSRIQNIQYKVESAFDGDAGLRAIKEFVPDCLLLDYSLPGRDGLAILEIVRRRHPDLPVVFLTGQGNDRIAATALRGGAQDYISKSSVSDGLLHQTVQNACERQALLLRVRSQQETLTLFTRALAHDLKEPIRTVRSFCRLATEGGDLSPTDQNYLETAISAADHMERLVDMVRTYTQLQDGQGSIQRRDIPARRALDQALLNLKLQLSEIPHEIEIGDLPHICADETQAVCLFQNLVSNALNYCDKPVAKIRIRFEPGDGEHLISVEDNGPGIDPAMAIEVFEPFKRLSDGRRRGAGLGLSICQRIVEQHQGRIWFDSESRKGARARFTLPRGIGAAPDAEPERAAAGQPAMGSRRIANVLLVEDNPNDILLTEVMLQRRDHAELNISTARNGQEALDFLGDSSRPSIDLILLDINMPVMNGFEFLRRYRESGGDKPVIICSTSDDPSDQRRARSLGASAYVTKPVRLANLEPAIRSCPSITVRHEAERAHLEVAV